MICKACGKYFEEKYSKWCSGDYCSRSCSNRRNWSAEQKKFISEMVKKSEKFKRYQENVVFPKKKYECTVCGSEYEGYNKYKKCESCRRSVKRYHDNPKSLKDLSKRTVSKMLKRADKGCSLCGWKKATCDIHHIVPQSEGGKDSHDNLVLVCPNCHRTIHELGDEFVERRILLENSLENTFQDWKEYYMISNI